MTYLNNLVHTPPFPTWDSTCTKPSCFQTSKFLFHHPVEGQLSIQLFFPITVKTIHLHIILEIQKTNWKHEELKYKTHGYPALKFTIISVTPGNSHPNVSHFQCISKLILCIRLFNLLRWQSSKIMSLVHWESRMAELPWNIFFLVAFKFKQ